MLHIQRYNNMSVFELISDIQKKFENLDKNWVRFESKERNALLSESISKITILQNISLAEANCVGNQAITIVPEKKQPIAHDPDSQILDRLMQCVKMLAYSGKFDLNAISTYLDISTEKAKLLMDQWKSEKN